MKKFAFNNNKIAIVDYGIEKNHSLTEILSELGIDFKVTSNESEILHSDKIILPNTESISNAVKQLHLRNRFTMLRMGNKPMLGISNGMHRMSSYTKDGGLHVLESFLEQQKNLAEKIREVEFQDTTQLFELKRANF